MSTATNNKFKVKPRPHIDEAAVKAFLDGADSNSPRDAQPTATAEDDAGKTPASWKKLDDQRRIPSFPMRFTDLERAQLSAVTKGGKSPSMHQYCLNAIKKAIAADLKKVI